MGSGIEAEVRGQVAVRNEAYRNPVKGSAQNHERRGGGGGGVQPTVAAEGVDRGGYLIDGDPGAEVRFHVSQAQPGQVHGVLG